MKIISSCVRDTFALGKRVASCLLPGDLICLYGDFGSGKTTLTKGIAMGLGIKGESVVSPSFVLLREYAHARLPLFHFDFYRLNAAQEILSIGFEEYLCAGGVVVIEWAEKLKQLLPEAFLEVRLGIMKDETRSLNFIGHGKRYQQFFKHTA